jgi:hypothetical protein
MGKAEEAEALLDSQWTAKDCPDDVSAAKRALSEKAAQFWAQLRNELDLYEEYYSKEVYEARKIKVKG